MASDAASLALDLPQLGLLPPLTSSAADEEVAEQPSSAWSSSFHARSSSNSTTPKSKQSSPRGSPPPPSSFSTSFRSSNSRFSPFSSRPDNSGWRGSLASTLRRGRYAGREQGQWPRRKKGGGWSGWWPRRSSRSITAWIGVVAFFFLMNWWMFSRLQEPSDGREQARFLNDTSLSSSILAMIARGFRGDSNKHRVYLFEESSLTLTDIVSLLCLLSLIVAAVLSEKLLI